MIGAGGTEGWSARSRALNEESSSLRPEELLAHVTGKTSEQIREDTERDKVLTAEQAVEYGVVDAVITERETA